jgi:hypothetical protein
LFHVSLQTACLDDELIAQKGFQASEMLMADSVSLLRRKIQDVSLAVQDGTMNSVITLATIEVSGKFTLAPCVTRYLFETVADASELSVRQRKHRGQHSSC